jgi:membrane associated rhomboid family serine protease
MIPFRDNIPSRSFPLINIALILANVGNMWYLWIFGDNVEDRLGHFNYLIFYLVCVFGAGIVHTIFNYDVKVPSIGASGAIAGV